MIKFFKINDPYRLAVLTVIFLAIRSVIFLFDLPFTYPELKFFLAARAMADGKWLYRDIWETAEPFTTLVYYLLPSSSHAFSATAYWVNVMLLLFNALYINSQFHRFDILNEKTYLPAFFYLFLSLCFIEMNTLSAPMLASTFLLFVISNMLFYLKIEETQRMYDAGFFLGIASLFHLPCAVFALALIASLVFFTRGTGKSYLLLLLGAMFPWLIVCVVFLWFNGLDAFLNIFLAHYFTAAHNYISGTELAYILLIPGLVFLVALISSLKGNIREINYQNICRRFLFLWLLGSLIVLIVSPFKSLALIQLFLAPLSFFYTFYFIQIKKMRTANLVLFLAIIGMVVLQVQSISGGAWKSSVDQLVVNTKESPLTKNKRLLVTGDSSVYYLNATIATKYLNWDLSQIDFANTNEFYHIESIKKSFDKEMPEVIIDQQHIMSKVFKRIPSLQDDYMLYKSGVYVLRTKK